VFKATKVHKDLMELVLKVAKELRVPKVTTVLVELVLKGHKVLKVTKVFRVFKDYKAELVETVFKVT